MPNFSEVSAPKSDAFADEALTYLDALYGVACKLTRNPTEAEDLVQDAFVKAMRARDQFNAVERLGNVIGCSRDESIGE